eukprot:2638337-Pyramimonas_sp.AAC.1
MAIAPRLQKLMAFGATTDKKIPITVVKSSNVGKQTLDALASRIAWSFNALSDGRMPRSDWQGRALPNPGARLCEGWRVANVALRGDWEFIQTFCGFPGPTSVPNMCWKCNASPLQGDLCWTCTGAEAGWRKTLRSHSTYIRGLEQRGEPLPAIMGIRALRLEGILGDAMHSLDQGVTNMVVGNVMVEVMDSGDFGTNQDMKAANLDKHLKAYYKRTGERYQIDGKLSYVRIRKQGQWPSLSCKAAACKRLAPYALHLATVYDSGSEHDAWRRGACETLVKIYDIMGEGDRFLSPAAQRDLTSACRAFMGFYTMLAAEAFNAQ